MKVCHIISGLGLGGTEMTLLKLLSRIDSDRFSSILISLTDRGSMRAELKKSGLRVYTLGMQKNLFDIVLFFRLVKLLRRLKPDVVQTWMNNANLIGGIAGRFFTDSSVIWNVRQSNFERKVNKLRTVWVAKACAWLSYFVPKCVVCGSEAAFSVCSEMGYDDNRMEVIPNGFDLDEFQPDPVARCEIRAELEIPENCLVIGQVARFDSQKNQLDFVRAASLAHQKFPDVKFLLCGNEISWDNEVLVKWLEDFHLKAAFVLSGPRKDVNRLFAALDIYCSSSCGEGFPNVVGEAMSCGVPCVVTDVGDSGLLVGGCGTVVPAYDFKGLGHALIEMMEAGSEFRQNLGISARNRIAGNYSISVITRKYEVLYNLAGNRK